MGQATVDLPDPSPHPDSSRHKSADDLLSQLAAEQIDQLLADSGTSAESAEAPADPSQPDPFNPPVEEKAHENAPASLDAVKETLTAEAAVAAQLDDLFQQINESAPAEPKGEAVPPAPAGPEATPATTQATAAMAAEVDAALAAGTGPLLPPIEPTAVEEQKLLEERSALSASADEIAALGTVAQEQADNDALPSYLRPLEWINAPLQYCPEGVREAFGKIAILTLFNSLAVLLYVLIFRRHH
jgi:hypothetical protein